MLILHLIIRTFVWKQIPNSVNITLITADCTYDKYDMIFFCLCQILKVKVIRLNVCLYFTTQLNFTVRLMFLFLKFIIHRKFVYIYFVLLTHFLFCQSLSSTTPVFWAYASLSPKLNYIILGLERFKVTLPIAWFDFTLQYNWLYRVHILF